MKNIWVLYRKELKSYFSSWIAYLLMAFFAVVFGYFFYAATAIFVSRGMQAMMMGGMPMDMNEWIVRPLLMNVSVIGLFIIPMITMRLFAEEKRTGTIELLMTSPVRDYELIMAKWLSAVTLYAAILAISAVNLTYLFVYGEPDWKPILVGYLGLLLQGGCLLAIGTFVSTLTRNQIIAVGGTFAICMVLWVIDWVTAYDSSTWAEVLRYLSVVTHFEPFAKGVLDTKDVVFYVSMIFFGLFLTARSMESLRWRA
ncbi:MAG TPA: ABC transporter permease [Bryobacteraceae bacterium]|nr:ABC transporter permease [Bryobacteraceae bacterium]HOL70810.1 ABC transporter permease [Bryobacteraceae bacterium]HOQ43743.1 ABC transporter permease [Bryobacteraceae bacterium]HPQ14451.1 ABC transporter permease [Bryobacteraceae bacterium]HPU71814.1 ABC transporter permease [Bryobacteraceae bacterium]